MDRNKDIDREDDWFDRFFDMDEEFRSMRERMQRMFAGFGEGMMGRTDNENPNVRFYGYNMFVGPDGVPHVKEFGNFRPGRPRGAPEGPEQVERGSPEQVDQDAPEGLPEQAQDRSCHPIRRLVRRLRGQDDDRFYDIQDCGENLMITVELPGVEKEQINLELVEDNILHLKVDTERKKVDKDIPLPENVMPGSIKAKCKNGVLEVTLAKKEEVKKKTKKVDIE
jgi:HSP20 family protein